MALNYGRERHEAFVLGKKPSAAPKQTLRITASGRVKSSQGLREPDDGHRHRRSKETLGDRSKRCGVVNHGPDHGERNRRSGYRYKGLGLLVDLQHDGDFFLTRALGGDPFTKRAGVLTVEGFLHSLSQRSGLREIMDHVHPSYSLKKSKWPSDRHEKREGHHQRHDAVADLH